MNYLNSFTHVFLRRFNLSSFFPSAKSALINYKLCTSKIISVQTAQSKIDLSTEIETFQYMVHLCWYICSWYVTMPKGED